MEDSDRINAKLGFIDTPTRKLNRLKRRKPRTGRFWCGCDANLVGETEKCAVCGYRWAGFKMQRRELP